MNCWESPAKLNLYLAVVGIRDSDGFHELDSLVAQLSFGDKLSVDVSSDNVDHFSCNDSRLQWNQNNLIRRAVELYRRRTGFAQALSITLDKKIPLGSGLGGGSSNASTLLKAINTLNSKQVDPQELQNWSAELGSDCPLFFGNGIVRIQGRGERVTPVKSRTLDQLREMKVLLFHPGFGISAAWAYRALKEGFPVGYTAPKVAETELQSWLRSDETSFSDLPFRNDLGVVIDRKYLPIPTLRKLFHEQLGTELKMSGSGSACYCLVPASMDTTTIVELVRKCWGEHCFVQECTMVSP